MTEEKRDEILARIQPSEKPTDLAGCDLVIEAVFESQDLKHQVFGEIEDVVEPDALLCSNTSTLPITGLATGVQRQEDFIGLHFFSPVERMPLVEIIVGKQTSDAALAKAYDVVRQIKKTPIVVNDSRGFFTSRVFGTLVLEGVAMLGEGIDPVTIERAATQMGFPAPPLAMVDEVSLVLPQKIAAEAAKVAEAAGAGAFASPAMKVVDRMVDEFDRKGKAAGAGFYDYPADGQEDPLAGPVGALRRPEQEPGPRPGVPRPPGALHFRDVARDHQVRRGRACCARLPTPTSARSSGSASRRCTAVRSSTSTATEGGVAGFAERARELAAAYGPQFEPPALLVAKAEANERF